MSKRQTWQQQEGRSAEDCVQEYVKRIDAAATSHVEELPNAASLPSNRKKLQRSQQVPQAWAIRSDACTPSGSAA